MYDCMHSPAEDEDSTHFSIDRRETREVLAITEVLLAIDDCWEKETNFSPGRQSLKGHPFSSTWSYTSAYTKSQRTFSEFRKKKEGERGWRQGQREVEGEEGRERERE